MRVVCCLSLLLALCSTLKGDTHAAANCELATVQAAVDAADDGDTVTVPAGSCVWSGALLLPSAKTILLQGAGKDVTLISSSAYAAINIQDSDSRVTGFGITINSGAGVRTQAWDWRVDHCSFTASSFTNGVYVRPATVSGEAHPTGVVDNCTFTNCNVLVSGTSAMLNEADQQHDLWYEAFSPGSQYSVFVEDNTFTGTVHGNAVDANYGGRYVFRYNTVTDLYLEAHSVQSWHRATRSFEIYNNSINQSSRSMYVPFFLRAGTGVVYDNAITGTWGSAKVFFDNIRTMNYRSSYNGICSGGSTWDGNEAISGGTGTHTGDNNAATLTDSAQSFEANALLRSVYTGTHTGSNDASVLTDSEQSWEASDRIGSLVHNTTDGSWCQITANTSNTATCTLTGGTDNNWDTNDEYKITAGYWVWNLTDGSKCQIVSHTSNAVACTLAGGTENDWDSEDQYKISDGYPCRDQIGRGADSALSSNEDLKSQADAPVYVWDNWIDADEDGVYDVGETAVTVSVGANYQVHIAADRDYFETEDESYTPYTYPHPLRGGGEADVTAPVVSITSPTADATYETSSSPVNLGGTASDAVGVTSVTWSNDKGGSGSASGTTEWTITGISLQSGANVITITGRDAANNEGTDTLTVTYTPPESGAMSRARLH